MLDPLARGAYARGMRDPPSAPTLPRRFFRRDAITVAQALLGQLLVSVVNGHVTAGRIVEVEAYLGVQDRAAHTFGGRRTARNESMWGDGGFAYVYFVYGMHHCVNVVAGRVDQPVAVLLRALEPEHGLDVMQARRVRASRPTDLCSGPAKLCQALGVTTEHNGADLVSGHQQLCLERLRQRALPARAIGVGPRIGVAYAGDWADAPLRFWVRGSPHVSR